MTVDEIKEIKYLLSKRYSCFYDSANFWISEIAYQLAVANELQVERNKELKRSVDLQQQSAEEQFIRNQQYYNFQNSLFGQEEGTK